MVELDSIFADDGPLAQIAPGYRLRTQQVDMAHAVSEAISQQSILVAEAGTGTGKTFAYLIPSLLSGGKVIVSTGTKTLQDQLFNRDIPAVRKALKVPVTVAILKGRANYICYYHLDRAAHEGRFMNRDDAHYLPLIKSYVANSDSGDKGGLTSVPENAGIWGHVTSTRDNCLGQECAWHKDCFILEARKRAMAADVVVVNHHLFFADVWLRDEGVTELLPACNTVIFDEAHQLPETASLFFGESVGGGQLLELARDATVEALTHAKDFAALPEAAGALEKSLRDVRLSLKEENARLTQEAAKRLSGFIPAVAELADRLEDLVRHLESQAERAEGLENCWKRGVELAGRIRRWRDGTDGSHVFWLEVSSQSLHFNATPLSIADIFRKQLTANPRAWIFTSATLAVKGDFSHYCAEMGLSEARAACWDSPFDYPKQAVLYVPSGLPEPSSRDYTASVVEAALPVLIASRGRAFLLFTSLRAMRLGHELLRDAWEKAGLDYPILVQGESARSELLERFRSLNNAVLLGSQSFWEGVDVRGEALSLVVIDKLPFAPPDDPVLAARIDHINRQGRNAFMEYQLPQAVISLKQGAGRLIRSEDDYGVLMICDPRLLTKSYGRRIWQGLPPMKRTRDLAEVEAFFAFCSSGQVGMVA
ncbi:MAG: ATP-dependent DNA helicase [Sulfuricellaceae bacterium]|nr:ATP-dependent DNA helicase [Sulfuricellaceae bacterium]